MTQGIVQRVVHGRHTRTLQICDGLARDTTDPTLDARRLTRPIEPAIIKEMKTQSIADRLRRGLWRIPYSARLPRHSGREKGDVIAQPRDNVMSGLPFNLQER